MFHKLRSRKAVTAKDRIFINYRRSDTEGYAGRLEDTLREYFGQDRVFRDIRGIAPGEDFKQKIDESLERTAAFIVLIGPNWLSSQASGKPRLHEPSDMVAHEIKAALDAKHVIVPVLVQATNMPREEDLPDELKALAQHNAVSISDANWAYDTSRLAKVLAIDVRSVVERKLEWLKLAVVSCLVFPMVFTLGIFATPEFRDKAIRARADKAMGSFKITDRALRDLKDLEEIPDDVLAKLEKLKGQEFRGGGERQLGTILKTEIAEGVTDQHIGKILKHTASTIEDEKKAQTQRIAAINPFAILLAVLLLAATRTWFDQTRRKYVWAAIAVGCLGVISTFFYYLYDVGEEPTAMVPSDEYFAFIATSIIMTIMLGLLGVSGFKPNDSTR